MSNRRPHIPVKLKLEVALRQLGLDPATARLDHNPALERRNHLYDAGGNFRGYQPAANDPLYMQWLSDAAHKRKTFGRGATTAGSDIGEIAKTRRLEERRIAEIAAIPDTEIDTSDMPEVDLSFFKRARLVNPGRKIASRGFDKRKRPMRRAKR